MRPCHFFLRREGVLEIGHLVVFLFHHCITYCDKCKLCINGGTRKVISYLNGLLGPDIFSTLWMKGQVLHREQVHLKVPNWSWVWSWSMCSPNSVRPKFFVTLYHDNHNQSYVPKTLRTQRTNSTLNFFPISEKTDEFSVRRDVEKKNLLKHVRFESLNGLPQSWGQFASLEFFIKKCRHDINKLKVNRNTKLSNHSSEDWSALKSLKKRRNIY